MKTGGFNPEHLIHTFQHHRRVHISLSFVTWSLWYKCPSLCPRCTSRQARTPPVRSPPFLLKSFTKRTCGETGRPERGGGGLVKTVMMMLTRTAMCAPFQTLCHRNMTEVQGSEPQSPPVDGLLSQLIVCYQSDTSSVCLEREEVPDAKVTAIKLSATPGKQAIGPLEEADGLSSSGSVPTLSPSRPHSSPPPGSCFFAFSF